MTPPWHHHPYITIILLDLAIDLQYMKIQCDVCSAAEASVFCCADEAALCGACDRRIHRANKLAGKHHRLSLHHPDSRPLCDVCQERGGFVFCQQDRAILCKDCDASIHGATALAMKHCRFLLTGVGLSSAPMPSPPVTAEAVEVQVSSRSTVIAGQTNCSSNNNSSSSISEYLMKTLPGWHVEDFLNDDSTAAGAGDGIFQINEAVPFLEPDEFGSWATPLPLAAMTAVAGGFYQGQKAAGLSKHSMNTRESRVDSHWGEDVFAVPQILGEQSSARGNTKRSRPALGS